MITLTVAIILIVFFINRHYYMKTAYYKMTHISYLSLCFNKGRLGEYYTYKYLEPLGGNKKYLFNCYLPKDDNTTTEIDVILLHNSGIYVFESKNYSGWIFGSEKQTNWVQTLPTKHRHSKKSYFFNPIIQNNVHIKWLQAYLKEFESAQFYSYIVFSDRCTLKKIALTSDNVHVINRYNLLKILSQNASLSKTYLSDTEINNIYNKLYPLTQISDMQKTAHINNVQSHNHKHSSTPNTSTQSLNSTVTYDKICPRCGRQLILRTATKGKNSGNKFYGCSNFPKCRYVENIKD